MTVADALATLRSALPNGYPRAALARVEDEIARLESELTEWRTSIATEKLTERAEAAEAASDEYERQANRTLDRAVAAEAEVARLRDGLRRIAEHDPMSNAIARALLAEDGAANSAARVTAALDDTDPLDAIRQAIYMGDNGQECVCSEHGGKCYMHAQQERAEAALDILAKQPAYLKEGLRDGIERLERSACRDVTEPVLRDLRALLAEDGAATERDASGGGRWRG